MSEFAKKETLRIVPQQFLTIKRDIVHLTYPNYIRFLPIILIMTIVFPSYYSKAELGTQ